MTWVKLLQFTNISPPSFENIPPTLLLAQLAPVHPRIDAPCTYRSRCKLVAKRHFFKSHYSACNFWILNLTRRDWWAKLDDGATCHAGSHRRPASRVMMDSQRRSTDYRTASHGFFQFGLKLLLQNFNIDSDTLTWNSNLTLILKHWF